MGLMRPAGSVVVGRPFWENGHWRQCCLWDEAKQHGWVHFVKARTVTGSGVVPVTRDGVPQLMRGLRDPDTHHESESGLAQLVRGWFSPRQWCFVRQWALYPCVGATKRAYRFLETTYDLWKLHKLQRLYTSILFLETFSHQALGVDTQQSAYGSGVLSSSVEESATTATSEHVIRGVLDAMHQLMKVHPYSNGTYSWGRVRWRPLTRGDCSVLLGLFHHTNPGIVAQAWNVLQWGLCGDNTLLFEALLENRHGFLSTALQFLESPYNDDVTVATCAVLATLSASGHPSNGWPEAIYEFPGIVRELVCLLDRNDQVGARAVRALVCMGACSKECAKRLTDWLVSESLDPAWSLHRRRNGLYILSEFASSWNCQRFTARDWPPSMLQRVASIVAKREQDPFVRYWGGQLLLSLCQHDVEWTRTVSENLDAVVGLIRFLPMCWERSEVFDHLPVRLDSSLDVARIITAILQTFEPFAEDPTRTSRDDGDAGDASTDDSSCDVWRVDHFVSDDLHELAFPPQEMSCWVFDQCVHLLLSATEELRETSLGRRVVERGFALVKWRFEVENDWSLESWEDVATNQMNIRCNWSLSCAQGASTPRQYQRNRAWKRRRWMVQWRQGINGHADRKIIPRAKRIRRVDNGDCEPERKRLCEAKQCQ